MQKGNRDILHYIHIRIFPSCRENKNSCVYRGSNSTMKFQVNVARQMPSTKASATKGAANRRSYLESRRNSSAGKQPGANIDSLMLILFFLRHATVQDETRRDEARQGLPASCVSLLSFLYTYSVVRFRFCFMQFSISEIRRVSPPGPRGIN